MNKKSNIELIRIISIIMVISIHVISQFHYKNHIYLYIEAFMKVSVPCFFMIMGYLFYENKNIKKVWINSITRFLIPLFFYFFFYEILYALFNNESYNFFESVTKILPSRIIYSNAYHLWFVWDVLTLYLFYPLIKIIIKNKYLLNGFIIVLFIYSIFLNTLSNLSNDFLFYIRFDYQLLYFLIGYKIKNIKFKMSNIIYFMLYILMIICSIVLFEKIEVPSNQIETFSFVDSLSYDSIFIFFASVFFFIGIIKFDFTNGIINYLASKTLGIYYIHLLYLFIFMKYFNYFLYSRYYIVIILIYILSLITVILFDTIKFLIKKIYKK